MNCNNLLKRVFKELMKLQFVARHKTYMHSPLTEANPIRLMWVGLRIFQPNKVGLG